MSEADLPQTSARQDSVGLGFSYNLVRRSTALNLFDHSEIQALGP
jgi:hypothetical protein